MNNIQPLRKLAMMRAITNRPQFPNKPTAAKYDAADQGLLKAFRKVKKVKTPGRVMPHSQTHAVAFGSGPDDGVA